MKVAALAPQFVMAAPEGEDSKDAERVQRHLAVAKVESPQATEASSEKSTEDETRSGLKRLAQFIARQRRAPDHEKPEAPTPELRERRVAQDSHEYMRLWLDWSKRPQVINSMAQVIADEMKRRRGLKEYKRMQAVRKKPTEETPTEAGGLPAVLNF